MGRPKGSKNRKGHKAGGDRHSTSSKCQKISSQPKDNPWTVAAAPPPCCPPLAEDPPPDSSRQKMEEELLAEECERMQKSRELLRRVYEHPSMK